MDSLSDTQPANDVSDSSTSLTRALVSGAVGGVCSVIVGHPFDLIKVQQQTCCTQLPSLASSSPSALAIARRIIAVSGFRGLYAGISAPLLGVTPIFAISFWGYGLGKSIVSVFSTHAAATHTFSISQLATAGFISAIPMTFATTPFERVKVLLQVQSSEPSSKNPHFTGTWHVVRHLYANGGISSLFRGATMTLARDAPGSAFYFASYEAVKRLLTPPTSANPNPSPSLTTICISGAVAGIAMWIPVFPIDTVKSRIQASQTDSKSESPSITRTIYRIYSTGRQTSANPSFFSGIRAFYPGLSSALIRAVPANAATFLGVEMTSRALSNLFD